MNFSRQSNHLRLIFGETEWIRSYATLVKVTGCKVIPPALVRSIVDGNVCWLIWQIENRGFFYVPVPSLDHETPPGRHRRRVGREPRGIRCGRRRCRRRCVEHTRSAVLQRCHVRICRREYYHYLIKRSYSVNYLLISIIWLRNCPIPLSHELDIVSCLV